MQIYSNLIRLKLLKMVHSPFNLWMAEQITFKILHRFCKREELMYWELERMTLERYFKLEESKPLVFAVLVLVIFPSCIMILSLNFPPSTYAEANNSKSLNGYKNNNMQKVQRYIQPGRHPTNISNSELECLNFPNLSNHRISILVMLLTWLNLDSTFSF